MAIAAASLFALVFFCPGRNFTVFRTDLMHLQKRLACDSFISVFGAEKKILFR